MLYCYVIGLQIQDYDTDISYKMKGYILVTWTDISNMHNAMGVSSDTLVLKRDKI